MHTAYICYGKYIFDRVLNESKMELLDLWYFTDMTKPNLQAIQHYFNF